MDPPRARNPAPVKEAAVERDVRPGRAARLGPSAGGGRPVALDDHHGHAVPDESARVVAQVGDDLPRYIGVPAGADRQGAGRLTRPGAWGAPGTAVCVLTRAGVPGPPSVARTAVRRSAAV
ncbi:hypothetical protein GCM10010300_57200 [Streptomyces olivaceoviridis]|nr:hypothetical protein GCM10010300_57200 [Streptomyces olivaceoviridis]